MTSELHRKRKKISLNRKDEPMEELVKGTDKKTLAIWATDCTERVLPYFEENYPEDLRPRFPRIILIPPCAMINAGLPPLT